MEATIIIIGNEILSGEGLDTNSQYIAKSLNDIGISVIMRLTVPDDIHNISEAINTASIKSELIIITGGLGPTNDDTTKIALCQFFNSELIFDNKTFNHIKSLFTHRKIPINDRNRQQAYIPENAKVLENKLGTAPGLLFTNEKRIIIALPGVPFEMKGLMKIQVIPYLQTNVQRKIFINKNIHTSGIPESILAEKLAGIENNLPKNISLAYLPNLGQVKIRLTAKGSNKTIIQNNIEDVVLQIENKISKFIFGYDDESLQEVIGKLLKMQKATIATAESCTGGYLAHLITSVPGSSEYYKGSMIAYSNDLKKEELGVDEGTLIEYGAVSKQTVEQMTKGALHKFDTTYAIATTGIAGPGGGTEEKPVGTVWIAVGSIRGIISKSFQFDLGRKQNIERTANLALNMLRLFMAKD